MRYWIDLFTWNTWQEFLKAGGTVSGFRESRWPTLQKMKPGDIFLCYLTGLSRFIGLLEVTGEPFRDDQPIWGEDVFPARVPVRVVLSLPPEQGVPVTSLSSILSYFQNLKSPHAWSGHFRGSPTEEKAEDARVIVSALEEAHRSPVVRSFDPRKLKRKVPVFHTKSGAVTVPENVEESVTQEIVAVQSEEVVPVSHEEIQWLLLDLGSQMGLDVWAARNDRGKSFQGRAFKDIPRLRTSLPTQFDEATNRTIELIDVLWLDGGAIAAAFEVEHTTSIHSGLLRMSDLVSMQPNINIRLYIVAPDDRWEKVYAEVNRPTFSKLKTPLREICQFIPYSSLKEKLKQVGDLVRYLRPNFLDEIAESLDEEFV